MPGNNRQSAWQEAPAVRTFGFANPDESVGSSNRSYESWLPVCPDMLPDDEMKIKEFSGGLYAVIRSQGPDDPFNIFPPVWGSLAKWLESNHYSHGNHQFLEEHLTRYETNSQGFVLDLYIPISE